MTGNICTRCGKLRITVKTYTEKVGNSEVIYTINECSDPSCQKIVDGLLKEEERIRTIMRNDQVKRELQRKEIMLRKKQALSV